MRRLGRVLWTVHWLAQSLFWATAGGVLAADFEWHPVGVGLGALFVIGAVFFAYVAGEAWKS